MLHPLLDDRGKNEEAGIRFRQQEIAQRTLAPNRLENPGVGLPRHVPGQAGISQIRVDQQTPGAEMREERGEILRNRRLALFRQHGNDADDLRPAVPERQIDGDLRRAQGLGEAGEGMIDRIPLQGIRRINSLRILRPVVFALDGRQRVDDLQHPQKIETQFIANMRRHAEHAVAIFPQRAKARAAHGADHERQRQDEAVLGIARIRGRRRRRDDSRLAHRKRLLLKRLLITLHERLIESCDRFRIRVPAPAIGRGSGSFRRSRRRGRTSPE